MTESTKPPWTHFSWKTCARWYPTTIPLEVDAEIHTPQPLIDAKNRIATAGPHHIWEYAKKITNPYELVYTYRDPHIPASLSVEKPLSRSYFKMIEMLELTQYIQARPQGTFRTAHVCEGPGGFIEAIYDIATKHGRRIRSTHAMTLRSTKSHIPGWRRAQNFMNRHRQIQIEYGADGTGNLLLAENRAAFIAQIRAESVNESPVHIFTADGGFDFTANYLAQESSIFQLLAASIHVGLSVLAHDGLFILKVFDLFAPASRQLLGWLASCFQRFTIYKPATSRPCNSEQYFIGVGFRGCSAAELAHLETVAFCPRRLFAEDVPASIETMIVQQSADMYAKQLQFLDNALNRVVRWANEPPTEETLVKLWTEVHGASQEFCRRFHVVHKYPVQPPNCRFALPTISTYESDDMPTDADHGRPAGSGADSAADSAPLIECQQSSTPGGETGCPTPSAASL